MGVRLAIAFLVLVVLGCAEGHCRRTMDAPPEAAAPPPPQADESADSPESDQVFVYKYDGSLQCGMGKAVSVDVMAKELQGIPIRSKSKKNDGLMHIQVCGSITGKANVYEIPAKMLKKAETKGFKKWTFE